MIARDSRPRKVAPMVPRPVARQIATMRSMPAIHDRPARNRPGAPPLVVALLLLAACRGTDRNTCVSQSAEAWIAIPDTGAVPLQGPTVIAFFPPMDSAKADSNPQLAEYDRFFTAGLSRAESLLTPRGIRVVRRLPTEVRVTEGDSALSWWPMSDAEMIGYYIAEPCRAPKLVFGLLDGDSLATTVSWYFAAQH